MQLEQETDSETVVDRSETDHQADALLELFLGLMAEFPDEEFCLCAMDRLGEAVASRWPAERRRKFALRRVASAARLGFWWN